MISKTWIAERLARLVDRHPVIVFLLVVFYVISPIDLLPEAFAGIAGFIDDVLVIVATLWLRRLGFRLRDRRATDSIDTTLDS